VTRLVIVGGGVVGLMTAYYAAPQAESVTVLDRSRVGDPGTASFSLTRSVRHDYLDHEYARQAAEARRLWLELQASAGRRLPVDCGCLNLAKASVTPDIEATYGARSFDVLAQLDLRRESLDGADLAGRFPQFDADAGWLDVDAGYADVTTVTEVLSAALRERGVQIREGAEITSIRRDGGAWEISTAEGSLTADAVVVAAGLGTNDVLAALDGCGLRFPLRPDRPAQSKYFIPPEEHRHWFTDSFLPVFAYLDVGIYGHPIVPGRTPGVKIGFYHPPDVEVVPSPIGSVEDFVAHCMPGLRAAEVVDVAVASGVDTCSYDLVADDEFIIGPVPGADRLYVGVGWRGTGYKFAPWAGLTLAQLAIRQDTGYDIGRFRPARFLAWEGGTTS
jgi:glycine/D-amino acid oxidase-like deaminating enzyme